MEIPEREREREREGEGEREAGEWRRVNSKCGGANRRASCKRLRY